MDFVELVVATHDGLAEHGIPHAFGGALALGYVATPRGTVDIDVNVFVPPTDIDRVASAFAPLGFRMQESPTSPPIAGVRFTHAVDPFPIDVFPALDDRYAVIATRVVHHPFGRAEDELPFLSAEDLCVFKLSFGRPQDWVDLAAIAQARHDLDIGYVEEQLVGLRGVAMYPRIARLRGLLRA